MTPPIDLYFAATPNGWKISIALEEFGLPYEVKPISLSKGEQHAPDFLTISPNNRIPAIVDPDGPDGAPVSIFESGAILQYLARKTGKLYGRTERERIAVEEWLFWQVGGLGPIAGQAHQFLTYGPAMDPPIDIPYAKDRFRTETERLYRVLDRRLAANRYVAGNFYSIADIAIWPWVSRWPRQHHNLDDTPHVKDWYEERVGTRAAVRRGRALMAASTDIPWITDTATHARMFGGQAD